MRFSSCLPFVTRPSQPCAICDTLPNLFLPPTTPTRGRHQFRPLPIPPSPLRGATQTLLATISFPRGWFTGIQQAKCRIARGGDAKPNPHSPVRPSTLARSLPISIAFSTQHSIHHSEATVSLDKKFLEDGQKQSLIKSSNKETLFMLSRRAAPTTGTILHRVTVQSTDRLQ